MSELSAAERVARGRRAAEIMEDPVYQEAMQLARDSYIAEWLGTTDPQKQFAAWASIHAIDNGLELGLRKFVSDGQVAAKELQKEEQ